MSVTTEKSGATSIRPFQVDVPDAALEDLRRRIGYDKASEISHYAIDRDLPLKQAALDKGGPELLPSSALYATAALRDGHTYLNFTPSLGASIPALDSS